MTISHEGAEKATPEKPKSQGAQPKQKSRLARLSLAALGVVFGDISTSPIYAIRECFHGQYGIDVSHANVMGILSLMFWALVLIVGLKYLTFVFRANNHGEGGEIALIALIRGKNGPSENRRRLGVIALGLFAACLLYGDGMITPAISVLSAVEGLAVITPLFKRYVIPVTIAILVGLFLIQRHGTARLGGLFGPVILVWLGFLAVTGAVQVAHTPQVLSAVFPWHAIRFLVFNKLHGFVVLGAVFLVVTGTEALYADMGHFGHPAHSSDLVCHCFSRPGVELFRAGSPSHGQSGNGGSSFLRYGARLGDGSDGVVGHPGHHHCLPGGHQRRFFHDPTSDPTGIPPAFEHPVYRRNANRPNLCGPGQLDAHGLHDLPCGRFSILQQTCGCIRVSCNLHDDH